MSKYKGQHGGKKVKNLGRGLPPAHFGQCPKENILFYRSPSLRLHLSGARASCIEIILSRLSNYFLRSFPIWRWLPAHHTLVGNSPKNPGLHQGSRLTHCQGTWEESRQSHPPCVAGWSEGAIEVTARPIIGIRERAGFSLKWSVKNPQTGHTPYCWLAFLSEPVPSDFCSAGLWPRPCLGPSHPGWWHRGR